MRAIARRHKQLDEQADQVVALELERLDTMIRVLWPKVLGGTIDGKKIAPDLPAMDRVLRLMDRRARYLGLDQPERHEHTGKDGGPIQHEYDFSHLSDAELDEQIRQLESEAEGITRGAAAAAPEA
jgi:hypothetical protein